MTFDRLVYIDRLKQAGIDEEAARAHAEALRDALGETVATKGDLLTVKTEFKADIVKLDHRIDVTARDLTIRGASGLIITATLIVGLKLFG